MLVSRPSLGRIIPVSQVLRYRGNLGKLVPNTPNHTQGHMKSNTKSSALCFTTNQTLLQCQGPLWVELYLFHRYLGIGQFGEIGPKYPKSCAGTHEKESKVFSSLFEVYHQRFCVNRLLIVMGARVLIGALKLRNTYT